MVNEQVNIPEKGSQSEYWLPERKMAKSVTKNNFNKLKHFF